MKILGISGSLRRGSFNTRLLEHAKSMLEDGVDFETAPIGDIPPYNQDDDGDDKPASVNRLKQAIENVDALLIVTPEYNYALPGVLKNAIDWASRPAFRSPLAHKPCGLLSAAASTGGGCRAQAQLKQVLLGTLSPVYPAPEFCVGRAFDAFDDEGRLQDPKLRDSLDDYLRGFVDWAGGR